MKTTQKTMKMTASQAMMYAHDTATNIGATLHAKDIVAGGRGFMGGAIL